MKSKIISTVILSFVFATSAHSRVTIFSPLSVQERETTAKGKLDQSVGFLAGVHGILPSGTNLDSQYFVIPYTLTYGLFDRVELGASWGLAGVDPDAESAQFGVTDFSIALRYNFFEADRALRQPGLDFEAGLSLPSGSYDRGLGTGGVGFLTNLGIVLPLDPVQVYFNSGYRYFTENSDNSQVGGIFTYSGGMRVKAESLGLNQKFKPVTFFAELKGLNHARLKINGVKAGPMPEELYLAPGLKYECSSSHAVFLNLLLGLSADASDFGLNLEVKF